MIHHIMARFSLHSLQHARATSLSQVQRTHRPVSRAALWLLILLFLAFSFELSIGNRAFWHTLGASTDTSSAQNTLGSGLSRDKHGILTVTDPTQAWMQVQSDGSSSYMRVDPISQPKGETARVISVRLDSDGAAQLATRISTTRTSYLQTHAKERIRMWVGEPAGTRIPISAIRANVRVPLTIHPLRIAILVCIGMLIMAFRPHSYLYRIPLNLRSRPQRALLVGTCSVIVLAGIAAAVWSIRLFGALVFHQPYAYTYDFDQYSHVADALLHGKVWLNLPVPQELANAANPYDVHTRNTLLNDDISPLYWDFAFYKGHWYSYFGVLPVLVFFLPYQLVTGSALPTPAAGYILVALATVCLIILTLTLVRRMSPNASVATGILCVCAALLGANIPYFWLRTNFYSVPVSCSMALTFFGLYQWVRASYHPVESLPLSRVALGSACIAANIGARPPFAASALLGFALFWPQVCSIFRGFKQHNKKFRAISLRIVIAVLLPAIILVSIFFSYNYARFGSFFDFGNTYQLTVTDITRFKPSFASWVQLIGYYLALPLRFTTSFPFMQLSPMPLPTWAFTEESVGGLFTITPFLVLLAAAFVCYRNLHERTMKIFSIVALTIAFPLLCFDAWAAGYGWRYMADFSWLVTFACLPCIIDFSEQTIATSRIGKFIARSIVALLIFMSLLICVFALFVPGRDDSIYANAPDLFFAFQSWFM